MGPTLAGRRPSHIVLRLNQNYRLLVDVAVLPDHLEAQIAADVLRTAELPLVLTDAHPSGNLILYANDAFLRLTGYGRGEVLGRNCRLLQGPETAAVAREMIAHAVRERREVEVEILNYRKDGSKFWNELRISPIRDDAGEITCFLGLQRDITERRDLSDALTASEDAALSQSQSDRTLREAERIGYAIDRQEWLAALQAAKRDSATRARLMAVAGHDLKQPLQVALSLIDRVRRRPGDMTSVNRLEHAVAALQRLGHELDALALASRNVGAIEPRQSAFHITELLTRLDGEWRDHAEALGVSLRVRQPAAIVISDPAMLRSILANLVGNALKYTPRGGRVVVGGRKRGSELHLEVMDNGPGIDAGKVGVIFDEFVRLESTESREGLGLGLSIVKRTAEALGHRLYVRSAPGRGSCFGVCIPLAAVPSSGSD